MNILTIVLGAIGCYQYYSQVIDKTWQLVSAVVYGTMKLYFFSPTLGPETDVSVLYEIAKWMAPICTSVAIVQILNRLFLHQKNKILYGFSEKIVIFGWNSHGPALINDIIDNKKGYGIALVPDRALDGAVQLELAKKGVNLYSGLSTEDSVMENKAMFAALKLNESRAVILMEEDGNNYQTFIKLMDFLSPNRDIELCIRCESDPLRNLMESMYYEAVDQDGSGKKKRINLKFFDVEENVARSLFFGKSAAKYPLFHREIRRVKEKKLSPSASVEEMAEALGVPHILMIGANRVSKALLHQIANQGTMQLYDNIKCTVVDAKAMSFVDSFVAEYFQFPRFMDLRGKDAAFETTKFNEALDETSQGDAPVSYIYINNGEVLQNLSILEKLIRLFPEVPIAFRNPEGMDLRELFKQERYAYAFDYGDIKAIMTTDIIIDEALDNRARYFNKNYSFISNQFEKSADEDWNDLSLIKQDSSRATSMHNTFKEAFYLAVTDSKRPREEVEQLKREILERYQNKKSFEDFNDQLIAFLERNPVIDYLTRLEHKRWSNFYYSKNYVYDEKKDEKNRTHNCLIDDWHVVLYEKYKITYPIFDLICVLAMFHVED